MDKFSIQNIQKITSLTSELEYEKASSLFLQLRVLIKNDKSYEPIRNHLRDLIKNYEKNNWSNENAVTNNQIKDSDLAEALVEAENEFYQKRKKLIKTKIKEAGLNQNDLAKILGHRKGYMCFLHLKTIPLFHFKSIPLLCKVNTNFPLLKERCFSLPGGARSPRKRNQNLRALCLFLSFFFISLLAILLFL